MVLRTALRQAALIGTHAVAIVLLLAGLGLSSQSGPTVASDNSGGVVENSTQAQNSRRPELRYGPRVISFGKVRIGATGPPATVTLSNRSRVPIGIKAITIANPNFSASQNCIGELPGGATCKVAVIVSPGRAGKTRSARVGAMLTIADNAAGSPHRVRLSAIAIRAANPGPTPTPPSNQPALVTKSIFVANSACDTVTTYPAGGTGNVAPIVPQTGLCRPTGVALDSKGNVYVTNGGNNGPAFSVTVFAPGSTGNAAPAATIAGPSTGLEFPAGITLDGSGNIYVTNIGGDAGQNDSVTIYPAGSNGNAAPSATISGSKTGLNSPTGIAIDGTGKIYIVNTASNSITVYPAGSNGNVAPSATIRGFKTGLSSPVAMTLDGSGNIYVANSGALDGGGGTITVYPAGSNGNVAPSAAITGRKTLLTSPTGVAVDGSGNIYVANLNVSSFNFSSFVETINPAVTVYTSGSNGNVAPIATIDDPGVSFPSGIALDAGKNIYVTSDAEVLNGTSDALVVYRAGSNSDVAPTATISGPNSALSSPAGITVDGSGNVYVCDSNSSAVTIYASDGSLSAAITGGNTGLAFPTGVALDGSGNIYVTDNSVPAVFVYPAGSNGNVAPSATISGSNTALNFPIGIALDAGGNIYVANNSNETGSGAVTIYAAGSNGNVAPSAIITGSKTQLTAPFGVALDSSKNIYVTNSDSSTSVSSVLVFPAGSNGNVSPNTSISGVETGLERPEWIALDGNGNIYVNASSFLGGGRIAVYPPGSSGDAAPNTTISGPTTGLNQPGGIALDKNGKIYVTNALPGSDSVTTYAAPAGERMAAVAGPNNAMSNPVATALDSGGNIYVANSPSQSFLFSGNLTVYASGSNASAIPAVTLGGVALISPAGIAFDSSGNIYITDNRLDAVLIAAPIVNGGNLLAAIEGGLTGLDAPTGIALDAAGNIYVANEFTDTVTVYPAQSDGNIPPIATIAGPGTGLAFPSGVALDAGGNIYVCNKATDTVTVYSAGSNGNASPSATIGGSSTLMDSPSGIALDSSGNIYVVNEGGFLGNNAGVTVFAAGSNGNVAPGATIAGTATQLARPQGIAVAP